MTEKKIDMDKVINAVDNDSNESIMKLNNRRIKQIKNDLFQKLHLKRKNIINNYFNVIVKWMENEYTNKKLIILGYVIFNFKPSLAFSIQHKINLSKSLSLDFL